jgi:hypothetical protein
MPIIKPSTIKPVKNEATSVLDLRALYDGTRDFTLRREAIAHIAATKPERFMVAAYPNFRQVDLDEKVPVHLYRYLFGCLEELHGDGFNWRPQYQKRGTCVGQGAKLCADVMLAINARVCGKKFKGRAAVAPMYAGSRVDVGKRPGTWDGSTGSWVAQWMVSRGCVLLEDLGLEDDATDTDERVAVRWTNSRTGVPDEIEDIARTLPFQGKYVVNDPDEAYMALLAGCPVIRCSSLIASGKRGKHGLSPIAKRGGHCELLWAVDFTDSGKRVWNEQNSWSSSWGTGPKFPRDMPPGSVNLTDSDVSRILSSGDCWALEGLSGLDPLPKNDLPF